MSDTKPVSGGSPRPVPSQTKPVAGGVPYPAPNLVTADQDTIVGNGTAEDPLRVSGSGLGVEVSDDGSPLSGGPFGRLDFSGSGVVASDAGGGEATITIAGGVIIRDEGGGIAGNPHSTLDFVGDGVAAVDVGAGVARISVPGSVSGILTWGYGDLTCAADTRKAIIQGGATNTNTLLSPPSLLNIPVPFTGVVSNLFAHHDGDAGDGSLVTYTVLKNGVPTSLAVSVETGSSGGRSNTTDSFSVSAGDVIALQASCAIDGGFFGRISCQVKSS